MLIKALCDYYDTLVGRGLISETYADMYAKNKVKYLVALTPEGKVESVMDWQVQNASKNKPEPRVIDVPFHLAFTGVHSYIFDNRGFYLFGLNYDKKTGTMSVDDRTNKARKAHAALVAINKPFFEDLDEPICRAYYNFLKTWDPEQETENEHLLSMSDCTSSYVAFCLSGRPDILLHESPAVKAKWERDYKKYTTRASERTAQCCITGETLPIAKVHDKIKGVPNAKSDCALICCNNPSECSYGHEQSYNSDISEEAMKKYTRALNYLFAHKDMHWRMLGDTIVMYWSASADERCEKAFTKSIVRTYDEDDDMMDTGEKNTDEVLNACVDGMQKGVVSVTKESMSNMFDEKTDFYIVGFKVATSRLSMRFIFRNSFGKIMDNIHMHQKDMQIWDKPRDVPIFLLWLAMQRGGIPHKSASSGKTNKPKPVDTAFMNQLLEAVIMGNPYPESLYMRTLLAVIHDNSADRNSSAIRMGILKACRNRQARIYGKKEEIQVSLDRSNTDPAYLCGRLFSLIESAQLQAAGTKLNRTIRDNYYQSAISKPSETFSILMPYLEIYKSKIMRKKGGFRNDDLTEVMDMFGNSFPEYLSPDEQARFALGDCHQTIETFRKAALKKDSASTKKGD